MKKPVISIGTKAIAALASVLLITGEAAAQLAGPGQFEPTRLSRRPIEVADIAPLADEPVAPYAASTREPQANQPSVSVHLASYHRRADAEAGWAILARQYAKILNDYAPIVREVDLGPKGRYVRLLAGPVLDIQDAERLCQDLQADGAYCALANTAGVLLPHEEWD
ncbi:MAG: SPOR domain-containing protein [Pseudomonadota bacterium]